MHFGLELLVIAALALATGAQAIGAKPTPDEIKTAGQWADEHFAPPKANVANPPISFVYDGKHSSEILGTWRFSQTKKKLDANRTQTTQTYTDPKTGLELRCVLVLYSDFPTVQWTLYFKNTGSTDTPILESIQSLDSNWTADKGDFLLHHAKGSPCSATDYQPLVTTLEPSAVKRITAAGGRSTNTDMSYFNLEMPGGGVIIVVGWPGQWASNWVRDAGNGLRVTAGQELTHLTLHPGEEVRAPSTILQFWQGGDWIRAQNVWRRWMMAHNMPRPGGKLPQPQLEAYSGRVYNEMVNGTEENQKMFIDRYLEEGIGLDYWWMDAGWYVNKGGWPNVGTWEVDAKRFPKGLRAVCDYAHAKGLKTLVWFEPERVDGGTWLAENHPNWIIGGNLLDLGNKDAWTWLVNHIDKLMTEQGIDLYRQDFNMDPLGNWRSNDAPDRQGITEIGHVTGLLAYWDELIKRHPNMLIDECASGGRRNDVECMARSVPLWRTDAAYGCTGTQCQTYGVSFWLPYNGTGTVACQNAPYHGEGSTPVEAYAFLSNAAPSLMLSMDVRHKDMDYAKLRELVGWHKQYLSPNYYGDYYPITPYSAEEKDWIGWQFDRPEVGQGIVEAFRRAESLDERQQLKLRGLDPEASYKITDVTANKTWTAKGSDLLDSGLVITITDKPGVCLIAYSKAK